MNNTTYWRPDLAELAYHYQNNETVEYIAEKAMPFKGLSIEKGSFRSPKEDTYFNQPNMLMSRTGYPNSFSFEDETTTYDMQPYGGSFDLSNLELSQFAQLGYRSQADMIKANVEWLASKARLNLEISFTTFLQTAGNYAAGFTRDVNAVSTKWSTLNTSDPLVDVIAAKEALWGTPTDMIIGKQALHWLMQHSKITGSSTVSGAKRAGLDPKVTPEYLAAYFGVPNVWVPGGIYNTTENTPGTMTKGWLWDSSYVWIGVLDKSTTLNPKVESFAYALALSVPEIKIGNFLAKETVDNRAGGVGVRSYDVVFYMQYKLRQQKLGYLMTNVI